MNARPALLRWSRGLAASPSVWITLSAVIFAWKARNAWLYPRLWAEDGFVFLVGALTDPLGSIFQSYSGYVHVIPRILALSALAVPLAWVPLVYAAVAFAITIAVMAYVATASMPVRHWHLSPLAFVVVPHSGEVMLTIANLQWITSICLAVVAVCPPAKDQGRRWLDLLVVGVCALSGPFAIVFLPLFVARVWFSRRNVQAWLLLAVVVLAAVIQLSVLTRAGLSADGPPAWPGFETLFHVVLGKGLGGWFAFAPRPPVPWGALVALPLAIAITGSFVCRESRETTLLLMLSACVVLGGAIVKHSNDLLALRALAPDGNGSRYFYMPGVFVTWMLWIAAWGRWKASRLAALLALGLLVANSINARRLPPTDIGWAEQVRKFEAGDPAPLRIVPEGWTVRLPRSAVESVRP